MDPLALLGIPLGLITCVIAGCFMRADRPWTRIAAICGFVLILPGYPWLTLLSILGLGAAFIGAPEEPSGHWFFVGSAVLWGAAILSYLRVIKVGESIGLPAYSNGSTFWAGLMIGQLFIVATHELAHTPAARRVRYSVMHLSIEPLTFSRSSGGLRLTSFIGFGRSMPAGTWARFPCGQRMPQSSTSD